MSFIRAKKFGKKIGKKSVNLAVKPLKYSSMTKNISSKALTVALREVSPESLHLASLKTSYDPSSLRDTPEDYTRWLPSHTPSLDLLDLQRQASDSFNQKPLFSVLMPVYNVPLRYLKQCVESVRNQSYQNWELCIADDNSTNKEIAPYLKALAKDDPRVKIVLREENGHISEATNSALGLASGDFISLIDNDDILWPNALYEYAKVINQKPQTEFIYSDEDKVDASGLNHTDPFFKPDWNPDFLRSVNYITHFATIKTDLAKRVGGFRKGYEGAQDWDLFLRCTRSTKNIEHVSKILYSWRIIPTSTAGGTAAKPYVVEAQRRALEDDAKEFSNGLSKITVGWNESYWKPEYPHDSSKLVSIIIPTKDKSNILKKCLDSIYKNTTYKNFEIILIDTGSTQPKTWSYYDQDLKNKDNLHILKWKGKVFSYSKACNFGAGKAKGEYLLFLNNDTEVITKDWLEKLLGDASRPEVGEVGCLLLYPGKGRRIQHAGTVIGAAADRAACNVGVNLPLDHLVFNQSLSIQNRRNYSALTAACIMIAKEKFNEVSGFDEDDFKVTFNDVDLGLKLVKAGYNNLYTPYVQLLHHESISLGDPQDSKRDNVEFRKAKKAFKKKWADFVSHDPSYNTNFTKDNALYRINQESWRTTGSSHTKS